MIQLIDFIYYNWLGYTGLMLHDTTNHFNAYNNIVLVSTSSWTSDYSVLNFPKWTYEMSKTYSDFIKGNDAPFYRTFSTAPERGSFLCYF